MKTKKQICAMLLAGIMLILTFVSNNIAFADDRARDISAINVTGLTVSPSKIKDGGNIRVDVTFDDTRGKIRKGDIISVSWISSGEAYLQGYANRFPLEISGQHVGDVVITRDGTTITFNEKIDNLDDVSGSVYFEVQGRNVTGTVEENTKSVSIWSGTKRADIDIHKSETGTTSVFYYKTGDMLPDDVNHIRWFLNINNEKAYADEEVYIEDCIQGGQELDPDSFEILVYGHRAGDFSGKNAINDFQNRFSGASITYNTGENTINVRIPEQYVSLNCFSIMYRTKITNSNQEYFENKTKAWYKENGKEAVHGKSFDYSVKNIHSGGNITGTVKGELKIFKVLNDSKTPIEGVRFQIERQDGNTIKNNLKKLELTTDINGSANVKGLSVGKYMVKEISAPDWIDFDPLNTPVLEFEIKDSDTEGVLLNIENSIKKVSIPVEKKWVGEVGEKAEIKLFADEKEISSIVLNAENDWKYTFTDLPQYDQTTKRKITYTISETAVKGYQTVIMGDSDKGFTVTNTSVLADLLISKIVKGEAGDKTRKFTFQVSVNDAEGNPLNGTYTCVGSIRDGYEQESTKPLDNTIQFKNGKAQILLSHGQQITIKDLPLNCTYTVAEKEENQDNYTTTYNNQSEQATGTLDKDTEVYVVNNKEFVPDTGITDRTHASIIVSIAISIIGISVLIGSYVLRKGRRQW